MKSRQVLLLSALLLVLLMSWMFLKSKNQGTSVDPVTGLVASLKVRIKDVKVIPTGDHAQLILTAEFEQSGQSPVRLEPPLVTLLTEDQLPAERYIGPMLPDPVLSGSGPADITLHFWLPQARLKSPLTLQVSGKTHAVNVPGI